MDRFGYIIKDLEGTVLCSELRFFSWGEAQRAAEAKAATIFIDTKIELVQTFGGSTAGFQIVSSSSPLTWVDPQKCVELANELCSIQRGMDFCYMVAGKLYIGLKNADVFKKIQAPETAERRNLSDDDTVCLVFKKKELDNCVFCYTALDARD